MAIIVEDGSNVPGANSYGDVAGLTAYAAARGITLVGDLEALLIRSMDQLEGEYWKGRRSNSDQALSFPRYGICIDGEILDSDEIPKQLVEGQYELAISLDGGVDPLADSDRVKSSVTVGPISVSYKDGSDEVTTHKYTNKLKDLLASGGGEIKRIR